MVTILDRKKPRGGLTEGARFLFDLYWTTYQALVDSAGSDRAIEAIKPYMKAHYSAGVPILKDNFRLKTDDLFSIAVYQKHINTLVGIMTENFQFFDHGYTADVHDCPCTHTSEAICTMTDATYRYQMEAVNSNYEVVGTRAIIRGDPYCQMMIKEKGYPIWGEVAKKAVEVPIPEVSYEEREYWGSAVYSQLWIYATNALVDYAGKERAVDILRPYMRALGMSIANNLFKELGSKDRDAVAIASIIDRCNRAANQKGRYTLSTPDRVEKEMTECIFSKASQDICAEALAARSGGICEAINPEYRFIPLRRMCKGDKTCKWAIAKLM